LSYKKCLKALDAYIDVKPSFVISHDCPQIVKQQICIGKIWASRTAELLQQMFDAHQPNLWIFGHHHIGFDSVLGKTRFVCLPELKTMDFPWRQQ